MALSKDPENLFKQLSGLKSYKETKSFTFPRKRMKLSDHLKALMELPALKSKITEDLIKEHCPSATNAQAIALMLTMKALTGDMRAIKEVADRLEGKPMQQVQLTGIDGGPIDVTTSTRESIISKLIPEASNRSKTTEIEQPE